MPPKQVVKTGGKKVSNSAAKPPAAAKQVFGCLTHENTLVEKHVVRLFSLGRTSQATIMHTSQNKRRGCSNRGRQRGSEQGYRTESERWRLPFAVAVYPVKFVCGVFFLNKGVKTKSPTAKDEKKDVGKKVWTKEDDMAKRIQIFYRHYRYKRGTHLLHTYTHTHTRIHTRTHAYTHTHTHTRIHTHAYTHTRTRIHTHTHTHTHSHAHTHTHTYTHTNLYTY